MRCARSFVAAAFFCISTWAVAADVLTYETDTNAPWTLASSPEASCRAFFAHAIESWTRYTAGTGICFHFHYFGVVEGRCKLAGFASGPPVECPPYSSGYPDNPYWHLYFTITGRAVTAAEKGLGQPKRHCTVGNPCDPATGNKTQVETDYIGTGPFPLRFVRTYNWLSRSLAGNLGPKWRHNYDRRLVVNGTRDAVGVFRDDGAIFKFERTGSTWTPDADVTDRLEEIVGGGWRLTLSSGDLVETYDGSGRLESIANRAGLTQTLSYFDSGPNAGVLRQVTDPFGRRLEFAYTPQNHLISLTDPDGRIISYEYKDAAVRLSSVAYPASGGPDTIRTYLYESSVDSYALTGIRDENGALFASFVYHGGVVIESKHAGDAGRVEIASPGSPSPRVRSHVAPGLSAERTYRFDEILGVKYNTSITGPACPECGPSSRTFDPGTGFPTSETDWNGNKTCFSYNSRGLEDARVEGLPSGASCVLGGALPADARKTWTDWHPFYRLPVRKAEPLRITTYVYGDPNDPNPGNRGSVLSRTVQATSDASGAQGFSAAPIGAGRTWTYTYNANGQVLTVDGPRTDVPDVTTYTYYPNDDPDLGKRGNVATVTDALGHITQVTAYNVHGQPVTIVDPNGLTTQLAYDARQRLSSREVGGELTSYEYDGVGQVTKVSLPDGSFLTYAYDPAHRLTGIADSLGNRIAYTLDLMGNRTKEEVFDPGNALAQTRSRVYSNLNRLGQEIGAQSQTTSYAYDNQGNVTAVTDPLSRVTANAYDALNRLKQMTDPATGITRYGYDGLNQLTSVTDPRSNATTYAIDGLGNLTAQLSPDTGSTANVQDAAGNVVASTDAKGQTTTSSYDALNRLTRIVYTQATGSALKQIDYAYDQGTNGIGRLTGITETSAAANILQTTAYGYDQRGRVTSEARTIGGVIATTSYAYDAAGRMSGMTYPSGRTTSYQFDALGRVNRIETSGGGTSQVVLQDVAYQPFGPVKAFTFGNLQPYARTFDLDGRITAHSLVNQTKVLAFDPASRITRIEQQGAPANFADYGYDALDRLTSAILPASTFAYGYDPVGNRLSKSTPSGTDTYTISPTSNRLSSITGAKTKTYAHDPNGSVTSDGLAGFLYDPRGRLVSSTSAIGTTTYQVNALGQRVRKTSSVGDVVFHYDSQGRLIAESSPTGAPIREYLWLGDQPVAMAAYQAAGEQCPATPTVDRSRSFSAFERRERMEVHSGRPGERGWEWGLGTNTRDFEASARADLDWVSGKPYAFTLTYDGAGNARVLVRDGATELFSLAWTGGMDAGNALRFVVRSPEGIGAGNRIALALTSIDGVAVAETLVTAGDNAASNVSRVYAAASLKDGYTVEGSVTFTFTGGYPPRGSRLDLTVTAGNVTCEGAGAAAGPATLYYVHADHLNTPRAVTNQSHQLVWRWENQEPFGNSPPEENPSELGSFEFNLRFPGQYADRETGLNYNYFRDYDPQTGRYVQSDPIGLAGGINPSLYVEGNPVRFSDPMGLDVYMCKRPLRALGGSGTRSGPDIFGNPLYHQYACVVIGGTQICGGQTIERASESQWWPWGPGLRSDDRFNPDTCAKRDDSVCMDNCMIGAIANPYRPSYGLFGPGTNCQDWADDALAQCRRQCKAQR